jgi:hypothetical protein
MNSIEGLLRKNSFERWMVEGLELTSGAPVDLLIEGHWISGNIEFWNDSYHWFSRSDGVPVILHSGLRVRASEGRFINF